VPNGTGKENEIPLKQIFHRFAVKHRETSCTCMAENEPAFQSSLKTAVLFEGVFPIQYTVTTLFLLPKEFITYNMFLGSSIHSPSTRNLYS